MKLYLIRHGETVDNVAGLYAGTLDSTLTNHGVEQTKRLGDYVARQDVKFTHIFSSPLSRAYKTAEAIRTAQGRLSSTSNGSEPNAVEIVKAQELIERDFGFYEGKPFSTRPDPKSPGGAARIEKDKSRPGYKDVESQEALATRIDVFMDHHLLPLFDNEDGSTELVVAIVAHGMLLAHFWRRLLLRLPKKSVTIAPEITAKKGNIILEHPGGWSNTGYMELSIRKGQTPEIVSESTIDESTQGRASPEPPTLPTPVPPPLQAEDAEVSGAAIERDEQEVTSKVTRTLTGWSTSILAIDNTTHLLGLKRQRGGIGSLAHDEGQRKLDSFFKKPRLA